MENYKCFIQGCSRDAVVFCRCKSEDNYFCSECVGLHLGGNVDHELEYLYSEILQENKEFLVKKAIECIKTCQKLKKNLFCDVKLLISQVEHRQQSISRQLCRTVKGYNDIINYLSSHSQVYTGKPLEIHEKIILRNKNHSNSIWSDWEISESAYKIDISRIQNPKSVPEPPSPDKSLEIQQFPVSETPLPDKFLYFFKANTTELQYISLTSLTLSSFPMRHNKPLGLKLIICEISDSELFIYGGSEVSLRDVYILSTKSFELLGKLAGSPRYSASSTYYEGKVYVFGGHNGEKSLLTTAAYSILNNTWEVLTPLPSASSCTSSVCFSSNFLVSGFNLTQIFTYSPLENTYNPSKLICNSNTHKIFCADTEKIYIITPKEILTSKDLATWATFPLETPALPNKWSLISCIVSKAPYFYFMYNDFILRRFNSEAATIEAVAKFSF